VTPPAQMSAGYADPGSPMVSAIPGAQPRRLLDLVSQVQRARSVKQIAFRDRTSRALNVSVALLGLIAGAPVILIIAALVKLTSPGPVIYMQPRVGLDRRRWGIDRRRGGRTGAPLRRGVDQGGRVFTIYKFRTMRSDRDGSQVWACSDDPRITPVGRLLRATRLDELPQLINVLKGDMNIVGPRPEQPDIFQELGKNVQNYRFRQRVLPGITGLAQVSMGYDRSLDDVRKKVGFDLEYIRGRSAATDLAIMAKTMPVMVFRKGAM
jgi:lipopolysaccharide/colanic/teichoic acid biosynthesis glycosyltransferase